MDIYVGNHQSVVHGVAACVYIYILDFNKTYLRVRTCFEHFDDVYSLSLPISIYLYPYLFLRVFIGADNYNIIFLFRFSSIPQNRPFEEAWQWLWQNVTMIQKRGMKQCVYCGFDLKKNKLISMAWEWKNSSGIVIAYSLVTAATAKSSINSTCYAGTLTLYVGGNKEGTQWMAMDSRNVNMNQQSFPSSHRQSLCSFGNVRMLLATVFLVAILSPFGGPFRCHSVYIVCNSVIAQFARCGTMCCLCCKRWCRIEANTMLITFFFKYIFG